MNLPHPDAAGIPIARHSLPKAVLNQDRSASRTERQERPAERPRKAGPSRRPEQLRRAFELARALEVELTKLAQSSEPTQRPVWTEAVASAASLTQLLTRSASALPAKSAPTLAQLQRFGQLVRDRRNAAGLSRAELGRKAHLSDATIKFIETAKHPASRSTLIRLVGVAELGLTWEDATLLYPEEPTPSIASLPSSETGVQAEARGALTCFVSPTFNPVGLAAELGCFLRGAGGQIEQTALYLDSQSAMDYVALCQQSPEVASLRAALPLGEMVARIAERMPGNGFNLIAVGAGDGQLEIRMAQALSSARPGLPLDLCLIDISQPLLASALRHASETFAAQPEVRAWGLQTSFYNLPLHTDLYAPSGPSRRRLFLLLGGTVGSLEHELRFLRHSLLGAAPDDLLLLDFHCAAAPADQPTEIKRRDKSWTAGLSPSYQTWLAGPLWRHDRTVCAVRFAWELETAGVVPESYALSAVATVQSNARAERRFSMLRIRRYDPDALARSLAECGWQRIAQLEYGLPGSRAGLMLCRRCGEGDPCSL